MKYLFTAIVFSWAGLAQAECVVLLHGLNRSSLSMFRLAHAIEAAGYDVVNHDYPTTDAPIRDIAAKEVPQAVAACPVDVPVNFVTHSLGGIVVRSFLAEHDLPRLNRVVMIAPPNHGSEVVDVLGDLALFEFMNGPAGSELGTDTQSVPNTLPPVDYTVGVIAGTDSINPVFSALIPGEDDGTVALASTKLDGAAGHITVPASHSLIMFSDETIEETLYFLQNGEFARQ